MEEDAFLAAIFERPGDPLPRLMFADWLEDHGDDRCEYIRAHESLANDPGESEIQSAWEAAALKRWNTADLMGLLNVAGWEIRFLACADCLERVWRLTARTRGVHPFRREANRLRWRVAENDAPAAGAVNSEFSEMTNQSAAFARGSLFGEYFGDLWGLLSLLPERYWSPHLGVPDGVFRMARQLGGLRKYESTWQRLRLCELMFYGRDLPMSQESRDFYRRVDA